MLIAIVAIVVLVGAACGTSEAGTASGVASLEDVAAADEPTTGDGATGTDSESVGLAADEAALEFSQCMRDEGLEFPDIGVDAQGNPDIRDAFQDAGIQPGSAEFDDAIEVCGEVLQGAGFGGGRQGFADNTELQDSLVAFSECLRDEGLDVGDVQLGGGQGGGQADGPGAGRGQGQGGFGDRSSRIAAGLGLDAEDPAVAAALDTCNPILDEAFASFGPGADNTSS